MGTVKNGAYMRINMNYRRLMPTEKRIADILLKNIDNVDTLSVNTIAEQAGASNATVTRFCKRLGYNGFKDFHVSAIKDIHSGAVTGENALEDTGDTSEHIIERICRSNAQACQDSILLLDSEQMDKAVELLLHRRNIILIGEGAVSAVMLDFYQKLLRLGLPVVYTQDQRFQRMHLSLAGPTDAVVAIDLTGSKRSTVDMAKQAHDAGAAVLTLCNSLGANIARWGSVNLCGPGRMGSSVSATLAPRIALLCIVDCLFTLLEKQMGEVAVESLRKTNEVIVEDWMD